MGEIGGVNSIFAIGLFQNECVFFLNKNLPAESHKQVENFIKTSRLTDQLSYETFFPLKFETRWGGYIFNDFSGTFEMQQTYRLINNIYMGIFNRI